MPGGTGDEYKPPGYEETLIPSRLDSRSGECQRFPRRQTGTDRYRERFALEEAESRIDEIATRFSGVMGVAIVDLTDGRRALLRNAEHVFPAASSIKLAILLELYHQEEQTRAGAKGKATLEDLYTFDPKDLVADSRIMGGLSANVT